mgnify:CR=1 FL=1
MDKQYCKTCEGTGEEQVPLSSVRHFAGKHRLAPTGRRPCTTCGGTGQAKDDYYEYGKEPEAAFELALLMIADAHEGVPPAV